MIKILFVAYSGYPNPNIGGSNKIIYEIIKRLDYSIFSPSFFSYDALIHYNSPDDLHSDQQGKRFLIRRTGANLYKNFPVYRLITSSPWYLKIHFRKRDRFFKKYMRFFNEFDVIHIHDSLAAYYFTSVNKPKKILTIHSKGAAVSEMKKQMQSNFFDRLLRKFAERERKACASMTFITFPSEAAKEMYLKDLGLIDKMNVKLIYNGIDIDYIKRIQPGQILKEFEIEKNDFDGLILSIADHIELKNIDILIKTIKKLREDHKKNFLLINAGTGYLTSELQSLAAQLKVSNQIRFLGQIPNETVIKLMKVCDFFIMPSERVVFDMVILEALAAGITVIVSNEGGNREIIKDKLNGFLLKAINETLITQTILTCCSINHRLNPVLDSTFEIQHMVNSFKALYD